MISHSSPFTFLANTVTVFLITITLLAPPSAASKSRIGRPAYEMDLNYRGRPLSPAGQQLYPPVQMQLELPKSNGQDEDNDEEQQTEFKTTGEINFEMTREYHSGTGSGSRKRIISTDFVAFHDDMQPQVVLRAAFWAKTADSVPVEAGGGGGGGEESIVSDDMGPAEHFVCAFLKLRTDTGEYGLTPSFTSQGYVDSMVTYGHPMFLRRRTYTVALRCDAIFYDLVGADAGMEGREEELEWIPEPLSA